MEAKKGYFLTDAEVITSNVPCTVDSNSITLKMPDIDYMYVGVIQAQHKTELAI
jgi:hypothetical protein